MLKNVGLLIVRCIGLAAAIIGWILIPHYCPGLYAYIGMALLCGAFIAFSYSTRDWQYTVPMTEQRKKLLKYVGIILVGVLTVGRFIAIVQGISQNQTVGYAVAGCFVFILMCETTAMMESPEQRRTKNMGSLGLCCIMLLFGGMRVIMRYYETGAKSFFRLFVIGLCLTVCLIAHFTYKIHYNDHNTELFWGYCFAIAMTLTYVVNLQMDTSPGEWQTFTATDYYKRNTTCELDSGRTFTYPGQTLEIGDSGEILEFEGWFHVSYFKPLEDEE